MPSSSQSPLDFFGPGVRKPLLIAGVVMLGLTLGYCTARQSQSVSEDLMMSIDETSDEASDESARPAMSVRPEEASDAEAFVDVHNPIPPDRIEPIFEEPYFPFLDDEPHDQSVSVGTVTNGHLVNARVLPLPGKTYDILPRQRARGLNYGSDEMIDLLVHASKMVWRSHGRRLWMGNIGRRGGGDIPWSVSHNSGRDADIAFAYTNARGIPVNPPDLIAVDKNGRSVTHGGAYYFDTKRTWTIVRALISARRIRVQFLFIANPLKKKLIEYARKKGEPRVLIERAEKVLVQPGYSSPHNDHLHLRIECSRRDVQGGCVHTGSVHAGVRLHSAALTERVQSVADKLSHLDPEQRGRAIERLVLLRAGNRLGQMQARLQDESPRVRTAAAWAIGEMGGGVHVGPLIARFNVETEGSVKVAILNSLEHIGGAGAGAFIARVIADPAHDNAFSGPLPKAIAACYSTPEPPPVDPEESQESPDFIGALDNRPVDASIFSGYIIDTSAMGYSVRLAAIEAAARSERPEPVKPLISVLTHADPILRGRAARALRRLTNHSMDVAWDDPAMGVEASESAAKGWRDWYARFGQQSRNTWLVAGFEASGYRVPKIDKRHTWELVRAIPHAAHLSYNAQRTLMDISGHHPRSLTWPRSDATWHWTRWFKRRRWKYRLGKPPADLIPYDR